jgi:hypothetical protein
MNKYFFEVCPCNPKNGGNGICGCTISKTIIDDFNYHSSFTSTSSVKLKEIEKILIKVEYKNEDVVLSEKVINHTKKIIEKYFNRGIIFRCGDKIFIEELLTILSVDSVFFSDAFILFMLTDFKK